VWYADKSIGKESVGDRNSSFGTVAYEHSSCNRPSHQQTCTWVHLAEADMFVVRTQSANPQSLRTLECGLSVPPRSMTGSRAAAG